jgi:hypothetical protein
LSRFKTLLSNSTCAATSWGQSTTRPSAAYTPPSRQGLTIGHVRAQLEHNSSTHSRVNLGHTVDRGAQVELKWERV